MWNGGSTELQVMKGYWTAIEAKPSQPIGETLCLVPIDDANCCYLHRLIFGLLVAQCEPAKREILRRWAGRLFDDSVSKNTERKKKGVCTIEIEYLHPVGDLPNL